MALVTVSYKAEAFEKKPCFTPVIKLEVSECFEFDSISSFPIVYLVELPWPENTE